MIEVPRIEARDIGQLDAAIRERRPAVVLNLLCAWPGAPGAWAEFIVRYRAYPLAHSELRSEVPLSRSLTELYNARVAHLE